MPCKKCKHDASMHRYTRLKPYLSRPCLFKDCGCIHYEPDEKEVELRVSVRPEFKLSRMYDSSFLCLEQTDEKGDKEGLFFRDDKLDDLIAAIHDFKKKGNEEVKV